VKQLKRPKCKHFNIDLNCKHCKSFYEQWVGKGSKLDKDGFEDAEKTINADSILIQNASNVYRQADELTRDNKLIYYEVLSQWIQKDQFDTEVDKIIMIRVSEGMKIKDISSELKSLKLPCWHRQTIRYIIRKYEQRWKIKTWTKHKLSPPWRKWKAPTRS
jgi:hypothetical protein